MKQCTKQIGVSFVTGLIFGIGLLVSGMTNPAKVLGFLDLFGLWDPSLALVMAGAIAVAFGAFRFALKRPVALLGDSMRLPAARAIDRRLVLGALTFGAGWGLAGFCPGPALASVASGASGPVVFVAAMLTGMAVFEFFERRVPAPLPNA